MEGWLQVVDTRRNWFCPQAPSGVPVLETEPLNRSQRDEDPLASLAYLEGLGPPCHQSPTAWAPLQQLRSFTMQKARAATSSSSSGSCVLPRNTEQNPLMSAPRPPHCCLPTAEHKREMSFGNRGPQGLSSLLLQSSRDGHALQQGQQQPQEEE